MLDLRWVQVESLLQIQNCSARGTLWLDGAVTRGDTRIQECELKSQLSANGLQCALFFLDRSTVSICISLIGLVCSSDLTITNCVIGSEVQTETEITIAIDRARISGNLEIADNSEIFGGTLAAICLVGIQVGGWLRLSQLKRVEASASKFAVLADAVRIEGQVFLDESTFIGEVHFYLAHIGLNFQAVQSRFSSTGTRSLTLDSTHFNSKVELSSTFDGPQCEPDKKSQSHHQNFQP